MPRISATNVQDGAATTGRAYEPAVTPDARDDDDTSVLGNRNAGRDKDVHGQFGPDSEHADSPGRNGGNVYDEAGLQPTYEVVDRDNERREHRHDHETGRREAMDESHRWRDHARASPDNPYGDHEPHKSHPWQTTYTGNADRPYGAERYGRDYGPGTGRSDAERDHDDRARYAEDRRREQERDAGRNDVRRDR